MSPRRGDALEFNTMVKESAKNAFYDEGTIGEEKMGKWAKWENEQGNVENKEEGNRRMEIRRKQKGREGRILRCSEGKSRRKTTEVGPEGSSSPVTPQAKKENRSEGPISGGAKSEEKEESGDRNPTGGEEKG